MLRQTMLTIAGDIRIVFYLLCLMLFEFFSFFLNNILQSVVVVFLSCGMAFETQ